MLYINNHLQLSIEYIDNIIILCKLGNLYYCIKFSVNWELLIIYIDGLLFIFY